MTELTPTAESPVRSPLRRLIGILAVHRQLVAAGCVAGGVLAVTTAAYPVALELLTARLVGAPALSPRWAGRVEAWGWDPQAFGEGLERWLVLGFVALVIAKGLAQASRIYAWGLLTQRVLLGLRTRLFDRLVAHDPTFFARRRLGDLVARLGPDAEAVERAVSNALPILLFDSAKFIALAVVAVVQYPGLVMVALGVLVGALVPILLFARWLKRHARQGQEAHGELMHRVVETAAGISVVQSYDAGAAEAARFDEAQRRYFNAALQALRIRAAHSPLMEGLGVAAVLVTVSMATTAGSAGATGPGQAVGFLLALVLMYEPLKNLARVNGALMPGLAAAERIFEVLDASPVVVEPRQPNALKQRPQGARFEDVWFRYDEDGPDVLQGLDFTLRRGRITGLIGPSGSGKSTVAALLPRLYDVRRGRVSVGGQDVRIFGPGRSARPDCGRLPRYVSFSRLRSGQHCLWHAGRDGQSDRRSRAAGSGPFVHRRVAGRLCDRVRGSRDAVVRRAAPAHCDRPRFSQGRARTGPRRGHIGAR